MLRFIRQYWPLFFPVGIITALFSVVVIECIHVLTPNEAEKQLDVACGILARTVAEAKSQVPSALLTRVCEGKKSRELMEKLLTGETPGAALIETFPYDAGAAAH